MNVTDIFTLFHKSSPASPSSVKGDGVQPVSVIDKMSLQPGQLFRGEVLGEDSEGHLLLKIGGEIISTRGLVSMTTGQQVWVEVKDVGDSPLFALAQAKGAVHELLKNIMEMRPAVLAQGRVGAAVPPEFQTRSEAPSEVSFVPKLAPIQADGSLPRETMQFFKALLSLEKMDVPPLPEAKLKQLSPFLIRETGKVDLGQVATVLSQTGKIPPVFSELAPLRPLFMFAGSSTLPLPGKVDTVEQPPPIIMDGSTRSSETLTSAITSAKSSASPVPFITSDGQVVAHTVQVVRSLLAAIPLLAGSSQQEPLPTELLAKGFTNLVTSILDQGKIPDSLRNLEPVQHVLQISGQVAVKGGALLQPVTAEELLQGFAQTAIPGKTLSPVDHNATVIKVLSSLQGAEPRPELLRVLKQFVASSQQVAASDDDGDLPTARVEEAVQGLSRAASFFKAQALVNQEVTQVSQGDCVLVPCFFAGQSGWGEWMWSHEQGKEGQGQDQEHLAFFLEMSNLGPVSIQAVLGEQSIAGQLQVADDNAYKAISQGLPVLEERLASLGYESHFSCRQKPVAVMQEIKDSLERRTSDFAPSSLVDIQA